MKVEKKQVRRSLERRLAKELSNEQLEKAVGGGGTVSCSCGCADDCDEPFNDY